MTYYEACRNMLLTPAHIFLYNLANLFEEKDRSSLSATRGAELLFITTGFGSVITCVLL